jgi:hypothetical protein
MKELIRIEKRVVEAKSPSTVLFIPKTGCRAQKVLSDKVA